MIVRKIAFVLAPVMIVVSVLPVVIGLSPAAAVAGSDMTCTTYSSTQTFSPGLPVAGDPTKIKPAITATSSFGGCVGLGITGGTASFAGTTTVAVNCDTPAITLTGTSTILWSNGETSIASNAQPINQGVFITSGLFAGASFNPTGGSVTFNAGACGTAPETSRFETGTELDLFLPPVGPAGCKQSHQCETTRSSSATTSAPGLAVTVTGAPTTGAGTVTLTVASGKLTCPNVASRVSQVAKFSEKGFVPSDRLNVTATLRLASSTSPEQVCFRSTVPFRSQSHAIPTAGTAFLSNCSQVSNAPPCVLSSTQVGSNVVVRFVVPGADPTFTIVTPHGREAWASKVGQGATGKRFSAHFATRGGLLPATWKITSGHLPQGCSLDAKTGTITGTPNAKGSYPISIQATDSERPPKKTTPLPVPITIA